MKQQNAALQAEADGFDADSAKAGNFIALVKKYTDFPELTATLINEFVQKIIVHEADRSSGKRVQRVDIHFNFIGAFDAPAIQDERDPAEIEAERQLDALREKRREYSRRANAKRKVRNGVMIAAEPPPAEAGTQETTA